MCTPAVLSPTAPASVPLTFGQFYTWPGGIARSLSAVGGLITNDPGNTGNIAVRVIQTGGSAPTGVPAVLGSDYILYPGASIVGVGLAPPGTENTEILGIYLFPVSAGSPTAWLSDVLSECPPGVVGYGSTLSPTPFSMSTTLGGEDLTNQVLGTANKVIPGTQYSRNTISITTVGQVLKPGFGQFHGYQSSNENTAAYWVQIWDGGFTGTLIFQDKVAGGTANAPGKGSAGSDILGPNGVPANTSISMGHSSTPGTYTAIGSLTGITSTGVVSR